MSFPRQRLQKLIATAVALGFFAVPDIGQLRAEEVYSPGFSTKFSVPPYTMDGTILGVDGWQTPASSGAKVAVDAVNYRVVDDPIGDQGSVLKLQREEPALIHLMNKFSEPIEGTIQIKAGMVFDLPARPHGSATNVIVPKVGAELTFGIDYAEGEGLFYAYQAPDAEKPAKVIVLGIDEVVEHKPYEFTITMNLYECLFSVEVRGDRPDGKPLAYSASEVEYQRRPRNLGDSLAAIGLWSSTAAVNSVYLTSLSVQPAP